MKFRVTYYPGTAQMESNYVAWLGETGRIKDYAQTKIMHFTTYKDALHGTAGAYMHTSDGVLIEYAKTCCDCEQEFYTKREDAVRCCECAADLILA